MVTHKTIGVPCGCTIEKAAEMLVEQAPARCFFNGIELQASQPSTSKEEIVAFYEKAYERRRQEYLASPEGQSQVVEEEAKRQAAQVETDGLIAMLPAMNFSDLNEIITWLGWLTSAASLSGVDTKRAYLLKVFSEKGFEPNVFTDSAFQENDREIWARWLIGQALNDISFLGVPHENLFFICADEWRRKFGG